MTPPLHASLDVAGRLVAADERLRLIEERAGGGIGHGLATPALATLARLARRLGILIARPVTLAEDFADCDAWVRARPVGDGVELTVALGEERPVVPARPDGAALLLVGADLRWATDAALRLTRLAPTPESRLTVDAAALLGQPLTRLFALDDGGDGPPLLDALAAERDVTEQGGRLRAGDRPVRIAAVARRDAGGGFAGFVGGAFLLPDAALPPLLAGHVAQRLERVLREPLGRIVATAETINAQADGPLGQEYVDYAADIADAARHLLGLVDDLADLEAIERPDFAPAREPIDLADLARRAAGLLGVRAADGDVAIARPAAGIALQAVGEFRRALQVLVNLIGNAVRYAPAGTTVHVVAQADGHRAAVIVADQGKGIAAADQPRIFEKFVRLDPAEPGGSGLGLHIARRLARAMGGDLTVDSAPGEGARFVFTLPRE